MGKNQPNMQEKINKLKEIRRQIYEQSKSGAMTYNRTEYLGIGKKTGKELYRVIEKISINGKTEKTELFYKFEDGEFDLIAKKQNDGKIMPAASYLDSDGIGNGEWKADLRDDIEERSIERDAELKLFLDKFGLKEAHVSSLSEIELNQKLEEKQNDEEMDEEKEHEHGQNESQKISEEKINKAGNIGLNEVPLNAPVDTKGTTLADKLNLKDYTKIIVVHSHRLSELTDSRGEKGKNNIARFNIIAQRKDGSYETIPDKLVLYTGQNTNVTKVKNVDEVETSRNECRYTVPGTDFSIVIDQEDPYGIPNVYFAQNTIDNNGLFGQKLQDKYDGKDRTNVEVRALFNANRGEYMTKEAVKEASEHSSNCKADIREADGNQNTASCLHKDSIIDYNGKNNAKFGKIAMIEGGCRSDEEIEDLLSLTNKILQNDDITPEKAIDQAIKERNDKIINESANPVLVRQIMKEKSVKNPRKVIDALNAASWEHDDAVDKLGKSKGDNNNN